MITYRCYGSHAVTYAKNGISEGEKTYIDIPSSTCKICGSREHVETVSRLYWCHSCRIPLYEPVCSLCHSFAEKFVSDCRIVFPEERLLLELILGEEPGFLEQSSVWNGTGNHYYVDGVKIPLRIAGLHQLDIPKLRCQYMMHVGELHTDYFEDMLSRFVRANQGRFCELEQEAMQYIQDVAADYGEGEMFVSFSGGKDSTVVADLVRRALANAGIVHIFGDTTLEFPDTYRYVEAYRQAYPDAYMISVRNEDKDFAELCDILGPPSRVMRWCCTVFKTGALNRGIESVFRHSSRILSFQGIRRNESVGRSKYDRTSAASKIGRQVVAAPIIDWFDFDVWLYIASTGISFNNAYRLGYTRVGCWCCPNNSLWSEFLSRIHMAGEYKDFHQRLVNFARRIGKPDPQEYIDSGNWKARQGGNGLPLSRSSVISDTPCVREEYSFYYDLTRPLEAEFYELFKPFGVPDFEMGNRRLGEVYIVNRDSAPVLRIQGRLQDTRVKIILDSIELMGVKSIARAKSLVECQITKYQMCIGCRACESVCRFGAIRISDREGTAEYLIDSMRCKGCRECVNHFNKGCYMRKILTIKR